jgi:hypothetical protein
MSSIFPVSMPDVARPPSLTARLDWMGAFLLAFLIYMCFFAAHYVMGDHSYRIAWAKALLDLHSFDISSYLPGAHYSKYGMGQTLLHAPLLLLSRLIERLTGLACEGPVNLMPYVLNGTLGVTLIYLLALRYGIPRRSAVVRAIIVGVASIWFVYTKVEYGESLVATAILAVWLLADRAVGRFDRRGGR